MAGNFDLTTHAKQQSCSKRNKTKVKYFPRYRFVLFYSILFSQTNLIKTVVVLVGMLYTLKLIIVVNTMLSFSQIST